MANYIPKCRSNYVRPIDPHSFRKLLSSFEGVELIEKEGKMGFICDDGLPERKDADDEYPSILDFAVQIGSLIQKDEVFVIQEIGYEANRFLCGASYAIQSSGAICTLSLDDIYGAAASAFSVDDGSISKCQL